MGSHLGGYETARRAILAIVEPSGGHLGLKKRWDMTQDLAGFGRSWHWGQRPGGSWASIMKGNYERIGPLDLARRATPFGGGGSKTPTANHRRPCPFGSAYVADSWARAWPRCRTMSSPSRFGKRSGNTWGRMNMKRKRKRKSRRRRLLGSLLGHSWGLLRASWGPLGGLLGPAGGLWGLLGGCLGAYLAVSGRSWPV